MIDLKPGDWVVCVDDGGWATAPEYRRWLDSGWRHPIRGEVYTVRDCGPGYNGNEPGCIRLEEIRNPLRARGEPNFLGSRFRKIDPKAIQVFQDIAANPKQKVRA